MIFLFSLNKSAVVGNFPRFQRFFVNYFAKLRAQDKIWHVCTKFTIRILSLFNLQNRNFVRISYIQGSSTYVLGILVPPYQLRRNSILLLQKVSYWNEIFNFSFFFLAYYQSNLCNLFPSQFRMSRYITIFVPQKMKLTILTKSYIFSPQYFMKGK